MLRNFVKISLGLINVGLHTLILPFQLSSIQSRLLLICMALDKDHTVTFLL